MQARHAMIAVALVYLALGFLYARIVPPLKGFDARAHFRYAAYLHETRRLPHLTPETVDISYELITQPPLYFAAIALATAPLPMPAARAYSWESENPYHEMGLSLRQSMTLPTMPAGVAATLWAARLVSLAGGLVTVLGAYALVRLLWPDAPWVALATAAVTGFNPQFLFTSVTVTNDAWTPAVSVLTLWLLARTVRHPTPGWRDWLLVGVAAGFAALTKYSCLLIAAPALWLLWPYVRRAGWRPAGQALAIMIAGALLVSGFWYLRNLTLYGSPIPLEQMAVALPTMQRAIPKSWPEVVETIPWLFTSYWGVFVSIIAPPAYLNTVTWLMLIAAGGLLVAWLAASVQRAPAHPARFALLFALVWFGVVFAGVLHWTRTIEFGEQGRLLHAAAPAFALLMVTGWLAWLPARLRPWLAMAIPFLFVGVALWPLPTLARAYALPEPMAPSIDVDRAIDATFAGGMRLIGADLPAGAALTPGQRLPVTLWFTTNQAITENYTLFIHLAGPQDELLYQFDGVPDRSRHPTRQWQPGVAFADRHTLAAAPVLTDTLATLSVGFYDHRDPAARQPVYDAGGAPLGDRLIIGPVRILATATEPPPVQDAPLARWADDLQLLAAEVMRDANGAPTAVQLAWQATETVQTDYTLFVQALDADNRVVAQIDRAPQAGVAPTSTWRKGDIFAGVYALESPATGWRRLILGLYDPTGTRLPLASPTPGQDFLVLLEQGR